MGGGPDQTTQETTNVTTNTSTNIRDIGVTGDQAVTVLSNLAGVTDRAIASNLATTDKTINGVIGIAGETGKTALHALEDLSNKYLDAAAGASQQIIASGERAAERANTQQGPLARALADNAPIITIVIGVVGVVIALRKR